MPLVGTWTFTTTVKVKSEYPDCSSRVTWSLFSGNVMVFQTLSGFPVSSTCPKNAL